MIWPPPVDRINSVAVAALNVSLRDQLDSFGWLTYAIVYASTERYASVWPRGELRPEKMTLLFEVQGRIQLPRVDRIIK
jgi:hypothetical protein